MALAYDLTGTPVKGCAAREEQLLDSMLGNEARGIDNSQFNELLLLVNKDRMEPPLYEYLFGRKASVGTITGAVQKFQTIAMLRYGNFVYAYRTLSRITAQEALMKELGNLPIGGPSVARYDDSQSQQLFLEFLSPELTCSATRRQCLKIQQ